MVSVLRRCSWIAEGKKFVKSCIFEQSYLFIYLLFFFLLYRGTEVIGPSLRLCFGKKPFFALKHLDQFVVHSLSY